MQLPTARLLSRTFTDIQIIGLRVALFREEDDLIERRFRTYPRFSRSEERRVGKEC